MAPIAIIVHKIIVYVQNVFFIDPDMLFTSILDQPFPCDIHNFAFFIFSNRVQSWGLIFSHSFKECTLKSGDVVLVVLKFLGGPI